MIFKRYFTFIALLLFTLSCSLDPAVLHLPKEGSFELLAGSRDGCDSGFSSRGNSFYRTFYKFSQKPELIENDEYFDAWYRGYIYCFHIANKRQFTEIDADLDPAYAKFWNGDYPNENPQIRWPWDQGVPMPDHGIKLPGQGEFHWNTMFMGCKTIFC